MFVPILTDVFNYWFIQGVIPGSITKGVITLLKKGGRRVWEDLDDYRPITLLNTELKILAWVLANRLQLVISDLIGPEYNYAVKERSIQDNLHLVGEVLEGLKDDTKPRWSIWISPRPSIGWTIGFWRWFWRPPDSNRSSANGPACYTITPGGGEGDQGAFKGVHARAVQQGCSLSSLLYVLALEPLLHRLMDGTANPALRRVLFAGCVRAKVSAYADDITVFVSHRT